MNEREYSLIMDTLRKGKIAGKWKIPMGAFRGTPIKAFYEKGLTERLDFLELNFRQSVSDEISSKRAQYEARLKILETISKKELKELGRIFGAKRGAGGGAKKKGLQRERHYNHQLRKLNDEKGHWKPKEKAEIKAIAPGVVKRLCSDGSTSGSKRLCSSPKGQD